MPDLERAEAADFDIPLLLERVLDGAQSFFEIVGPAVRAIWAVTRSTRSAFVMR
jgi:hypothetical protein